MSFDPRTVITHVDTRLGPVTLAATNQGLAGLWFSGQKHHPDTLAWRVDDGNPWLVQARTQLAEYLAGQRTGFELALDLRSGSVFQQAVWNALCTIPAGGTTSYGAVSRQIGRPSAVRAVGAAVGRNPVSIIVPCHRVLGANGALTGYAGGLERKAALLALESAAKDTRASGSSKTRAAAETGTIPACP
ncbi:MAG: methylated-DNA--[protein]-cysteine S-methyltransferase [Betaproteobacteria bacterium]